MTEKTLIVAKPDAVKRGLVGHIISRFEAKGFRILDLKLFQFTTEMAEKFYEPHKATPFFSRLVQFMTSGPVIGAILEGPLAIKVARKMVGSTDSTEAEPGTIRGDFGLGLRDNVIHASDSKDSFKRESKVIFS